MTNQHRATPEQWANVDRWFDLGCSVPSCILELRARVEELEAQYETQRLATLEWGKDVDNHGRWIDDHLKRIMALEAMATTRSFKIDTSKWSDEQRQQFLGELSEPTTFERFTDPRLGEPWMVQVDGIQHGPAIPPALATSDSLVERVANAIAAEPFLSSPTPVRKARAAIREVAAWLRQGHGDSGAWSTAAADLIKEANR
jgi:hypothetical protein